MNRFNSVVLDVDSTLSGMEGIDWLASLRGPEIEEAIAALTDQAMRGAIPLESVYGERLSAVRPTKDEVEELAMEYIAHLAPYAKHSITLMQTHGVEIALVSGGLREAILPLAAELALKENVVHAVPVFFDERGQYLGFDGRSPLTRQRGKLETVAALTLKKPLIAVGDGMTDTEIRACADSFAAYTGFVRREAVIAKADFIVEDFRQLADAVLG